MLTQHIQIENKVREESANKIAAMTQDIFAQLRQQLKDEQTERENNSESILRLVEEMCNRLDRKLHQIAY